MRREDVGWRLSLTVAALALAAWVWEMWWDKSLLGLLLMAPGVLVAGATLLVLALVAGRRAARRSVTLFVAVCALGYGVFRCREAGNYVRFETRWMMHRARFQHEVLVNADPGPGLQHVMWDDWGMAGQATLSYLVYDPTDQLKNAAKTEHGRSSAELPHEVWEVWRLEPHWYSVVFYTNEGWDWRE
jgi:hypothetical protein